MASVNKVILVGNLGRDPEMRYLPSGEAVANLAIATADSSRTSRVKWSSRPNGIASASSGAPQKSAGNISRRGVRSTSKQHPHPQVHRQGRHRKIRHRNPRRPHADAGSKGGGGMADMDDGGFNQAPARSQPRANAPAAAQRPPAVASMTWTTIFRFSLEDLGAADRSAHLMPTILNAVRIRPAMKRWGVAWGCLLGTANALGAVTEADYLADMPVVLSPMRLSQPVGDSPPLSR